MEHNFYTTQSICLVLEQSRVKFSTMIQLIKYLFTQTSQLTHPYYKHEQLCNSILLTSKTRDECSLQDIKVEWNMCLQVQQEGLHTLQNSSKAIWVYLCGYELRVYGGEGVGTGSDLVLSSPFLYLFYGFSYEEKKCTIFILSKSCIRDNNYATQRVAWSKNLYFWFRGIRMLHYPTSSSYWVNSFCSGTNPLRDMLLYSFYWGCFYEFLGQCLQFLNLVLHQSNGMVTSKQKEKKNTTSGVRHFRLFRCGRGDLARLA